MARLDETLGCVGFDNLIHGLFPPAEVFSAQIAAGQGVLERGSLLAVGENGMELISSTTTGKANAVLAEPVDTGEPAAQGQDGEDTGTEGEGTAETVMAAAYRTGHFNSNVLIVAEDYEITAEDKEALRIAGILLSDAVEI